MIATAAQPSRAMTIVLWVLRVLVAALFLLAAFAKLSGQQMMIDEFGMLSVGQWFRYIVGLMELLGGIAVLVNRYSISIRNSPCWSQTLLIAAPKKLINRDNWGTTCAWCRLALTSNTSEVAKARRFGKLVRLSGPRASSDTLQTTSAGHPMRSGRAALSAGIHGKARSSCEGFP